jgi:hypothetical protein
MLCADYEKHSLSDKGILMNRNRNVNESIIINGTYKPETYEETK